MVEHTKQALDVCQREYLQTGRYVPVIINDRADVALVAGADGVHVGQDDLDVGLVRRMLGPGKIVGASVKTV